MLTVECRLIQTYHSLAAGIQLKGSLKMLDEVSNIFNTIYLSGTG